MSNVDSSNTEPTLATLVSSLELFTDFCPPTKDHWEVYRIEAPRRTGQISDKVWMIFTEAEVQKLDVSSSIKENIIRLDVTVDVGEARVDIVHGLDQLGDVETGLLLRHGHGDHQQ